jgi:phage shock protein A
MTIRKSGIMSEVKFEEFHNLSYEEQLQHVEDKIQHARDAKKKNAESIKQLEGFIENCNEQIEVLLEMKFNVLHQQRMEEALAKIKDNVFGR